MSINSPQGCPEVPAQLGRVHPPQAPWFPTAHEGSPERDPAGCPSTVTVGLPIPDRERVLCGNYFRLVDGPGVVSRDAPGCAYVVAAQWG